jgi:hypothetical protein
MSGFQDSQKARMTESFPDFHGEKPPKHCLGKTPATKLQPQLLFQLDDSLTGCASLSRGIFTVKIGDAAASKRDKSRLSRWVSCGLRLDGCLAMLFKNATTEESWPSDRIQENYASW